MARSPATSPKWGDAVKNALCMRCRVTLPESLTRILVLFVSLDTYQASGICGALHLRAIEQGTTASNVRSYRKENERLCVVSLLYIVLLTKRAARVTSSLKDMLVKDMDIVSIACSDAENLLDVTESQWAVDPPAL
ncbi:hypothetical protein FRC18_008163 [Serendipita sp. 400]|nr:hypothetical protein FRC18_008163 [Serendipita sp. 400]